MKFILFLNATDATIEWLFTCYAWLNHAWDWPLGKLGRITSDYQEIAWQFAGKDYIRLCFFEHS